VPFVIFPGHDFLVTHPTQNVTKVTIYNDRTYIRVTSFESELFSNDADRMNSRASTSFRLFSSGNVAFVIVVSAAYLSAITALIYSHRSLPLGQVWVLIGGGAAYLVIGTHGFTICRRSGSLLAAVAYFAIQLLLAATLILLRGSSGELSLILLPLAGQSALLLPLAAMVPVCVFVYVTLVMPLLWHSRWVDAVAVALVYGTGIVFVVVFTRVAASEREARNQLAEANQQLREHAAQVEELAITKERNRLAREIHDNLGHYLTVVNVQIGAAQAILALDEPRALDHLAKAQTLTQEGLAEVRRSVAALRASPTESRPLTEALAKLVEQWKAAGMNVRLDVAGMVRSLTPQAELTLYRTAQEALTNVGKHAHAKQVGITLGYGDDSVRLRVKDDGVGSADSQGGFGLLGARERVQLLNGEMHVRTESGGGFALEVELPG
jgi:signal transduction histidine kinase